MVEAWRYKPCNFVGKQELGASLRRAGNRPRDMTYTTGKHFMTSLFIDPKYDPFILSDLLMYVFT